MSKDNIVKNLMNSEDARQERRKLKQELWQIRLFVEKERNIDGSDKELTENQARLKKIYENLPGFMSWKTFTEEWDIGDPYEVKRTAYIFNDIDKRNFEEAFGKPYETIVNKKIQTKE